MTKIGPVVGLISGVILIIGAIFNIFALWEYHILTKTSYSFAVAGDSLRKLILFRTIFTISCGLLTILGAKYASEKKKLGLIILVVIPLIIIIAIYYPIYSARLTISTITIRDGLYASFSPIEYIMIICSAVLTISTWND